MKYFGLFESLWKKLNWSTQILTNDNFDNLALGVGYANLKYRNEDLYYQYERKIRSKESRQYYVELKQIQDFKNIKPDLPILELRTDDFFPLNESVLPCIKSRINHIVEETLRIDIFRNVV